MGHLTRSSITLFLGVLATLLTTSPVHADWSTRETSLVRITPFPSPPRLPDAIAKFGVANDTRPRGIRLIVQPRPGVVLDYLTIEYKTQVRYRGLDGSVYSVERNLTPDKQGNGTVFIPCDVDEPLTVLVDVVTKAPVEEAR